MSRKPFTLAVASGKGGTGKTLVATNIAAIEAAKGQVVLIDCDVEAPNARLFFETETTKISDATTVLAAVNPSKCDGCGACSRSCAFGAIRILGDTAVVFDELCHGCGVCSYVCPKSAIKESKVRVGEVEVASAVRHEGLTLVSGMMDVGQVKAPEVIKSARDAARKFDADLAIVDSPPGVACSAVASLRAVDAVLLVTEPTPFGLHDLQLAAKLTQDLGRPMGVIVNRADTGSADIEGFCAEQSIPVVGSVPFERAIAAAYAKGALVLDEVSGVAEWLGQVVPSMRSIAADSPAKASAGSTTGTSA